MIAWQYVASFVPFFCTWLVAVAYSYGVRDERRRLTSGWQQAHDGAVLYYGADFYPDLPPG